MKKGILTTNVVTQVGIVVHDIEKTAQVYADFLGMPKPNIQTTDAIDKSQAKYKGSPTTARAKLAFFKVGPSLELELIQPDNEPSTWRDDLNRKGEGVHQAGEYTGGRYAYLDSTRDLKVILELLEND
jgi:hypothetical protein